MHGTDKESTRCSTNELAWSLRAFAPKLGITRIADLTDLDRIGVPVFAAVRPDALSISVYNGKGVCAATAEVSAIMEAAEHYYAEHAFHNVFKVTSTEEMRRQELQAIPLSRQTRATYRLIPDQQELAWIRGYRLSDGATVYAPYELVGLDLSSRSPWRTDLFRMTSLGLGAGTDINHATQHAIEELIEDDALFGLQFALKNGKLKPLHVPDAQSQQLRTILDRLSALGFTTRFADASRVLDYPVVACVVTDEMSHNAGPHTFGGFGCRSTATEAAMAALLEAVQSRLTFISGSRDDLFESEYSQKPLSINNGQYHSIVFDQEHTNQPETSSLQRVADSVTKSTNGDIYIFPLTPENHPYVVVRALADDLLSMAMPKHHVQGPRAGQRLLQTWG
jgi:ribosomal protein S12 methylthiotransferase accessory factor